ncbi:MAG: hypothetical protein JF588_24045 [Caulobacterales bacterium]|nr:hypothetical protein [Caulobacterales bacterium]
MSKLVRQIHRWLSVAFTLGFVTNTIVIFGLGQKTPAYWVYLLALVPLFALFFSGLYLFALPYVARWTARAPALARPS